ncbi:hypothetical protein CCMA1212_006701 [Trichoderma ghanense]|uniref:Fungal-type protein kinase domain-containing protein n=1 Tax=Trichoderma ghanense TaxID=65468 RepID=A0ABY2GZ66_9HYPO
MVSQHERSREVIPVPLAHGYCCPSGRTRRYVGLPRFLERRFSEAWRAFRQLLRLSTRSASTETAFFSVMAWMAQGCEAGRSGCAREASDDYPTATTKTWHSLNSLFRGSVAERKLDIGVVVDLPVENDFPYSWSQVLVPGELKSNPSAGIVSNAWRDLTRYVIEVLADQDARRSVLGFTLCGSLMRIWEFDSLGGIHSIREV